LAAPQGAVAGQTPDAAKSAASTKAK
jgi:hypothetical protein